MKGLLRNSVTVNAAIAGLSILIGLFAGHVTAGFALAAGLLIGAANGYLVLATLERRMPFTLASVVRLVVLTVIAIGVALLFGPVAWLALLGVAAAQVVMVVSAVRQGLRA